MSKGVNMVITNLSKRNIQWRWVPILMLLFGFISSLHSQDIGSRDMTRTKMWATIYNAGGIGDMHGDATAYKFDYPGFKEGADLWNSYGNAEWAGFMIWAKVDGVGIPFRYLLAYAPNAEKVRAKENPNLVKNYNLVDPAIPAEEVFTGGVELIEYGVDIDFRALAWSYPMYDDFLIYEYTLINTGDAELTDIRFAPTASLQLSLAANRWDDDLYEWDIEHQAFYFHDGRQYDPELQQFVTWQYGLTQSDLGEPADLGAPASINHDFQAPGYFTYYWLDQPEQSNPADPEHDHMNIVDKSNLVQHNSRLQIDPTNDNPEVDVDSDSYFYASMTYDQPPAPTLEDGTTLDAADALAIPRARGRYEYHLDYIYSTGPYDMSPGDSLKFVLAIVGGMMDYSYVANQVSTVAEALVNEAHLPEGGNSLWANVDAAVELYARGYDMPHPPPTPAYMGNEGPNSILVKGVAGGIKIQWDPIPDSYVDPDYLVDDVAGYRLYKSTFKSVGPWTLLEDIAVADVAAHLENSLITYVDTDAQLGVGYYYVVTAYDTPKSTPWPGDATVTTLPSLESGMVNGNSEPAYPMAPTSDELDDIRVYPNPFKQHSGLLGSGEGSRLEIVNIPAACTIRIYTLAGDLVRKIEHDDGSGDEAWGSRALGDYQVSKYLQFVAPGIYLVHVESNVEGHEGESKVGKFVIIK